MYFWFSLVFIALWVGSVAVIEAKNDTTKIIGELQTRDEAAPTCQDEQFQCYLFYVACKDVATKEYMHQSCRYTCGECVNRKERYAFPRKYRSFFSNPQFKYYSGNYYSSGYNGYCCGCYGGGFIGFAGNPAFGGYGLTGYGLLLNPIEGFLAGLGLTIGNTLANLGALLGHGALGSYGYGFGNNYYCLDYLPDCYLYVPYCYSPLSYYYSCMVRYCPMSCGFCLAGSVGGPGLIPGGGGYSNGGGGYYPSYGQGQQYPHGQGQQYPYGQGQQYPYGQGQQYPYGQDQQYPYYGQGQQYPYGQGQQYPYYGQGQQYPYGQQDPNGAQPGNGYQNGGGYQNANNNGGEYQNGK